MLSRWTGGELLRLQCYDGIDVAQAVYEWDYARQLLHLRTVEASAIASGAGGIGASAGRAVSGGGAGGAAPGGGAVGGSSGGTEEAGALERSLYSEEFLVRRPLLRAIADVVEDQPVPILLIDEIDRADDEFEAYLLEILSDFSVTVPELGTFTALRPPIVIVTSNRTRDVHDALKRRCLYHWVDHPDFDREVAIVRLRVPQAAVPLAREVAAAAASIRAMGLYKPPGVAETIDWAQALTMLGATHLDEQVVERTLGAVLKYREDAERVRASGLPELVAEARRRGA